MLKRIFDTTEVDRFADVLLEELKRALPTNAKAKVAKKIGARADALDMLVDHKVAEFVKTAKLNVFKKARLGSRLREGITELGYSEDFVKSFSLDVLSRVQAASK